MYAIHSEEQIRVFSFSDRKIFFGGRGGVGDRENDYSMKEIVTSELPNCEMYKIKGNATLKHIVL